MSDLIPGNDPETESEKVRGAWVLPLLILVVLAILVGVGYLAMR